MNRHLIELPRHSTKQADATVDFGDGKIVEFQINTRGCKDDNEKAMLEYEAINILKEMQSQKRQDGTKLTFTSNAHSFTFNRGIGRNIKSCKITGPIELCICKILFWKKLHTTGFNDAFLQVVNKIYTKYTGDVLNDLEQIRSAVNRINKKVRNRFGIEDDVIEFNGRTGIIGANKNLF